ncbi:MAG: YeeE/YedE thiosulfate transporter family protein [Pseudomonadota bacterium]
MPRPYANPYLAGVALGLVLLLCFALTGQGLGASGAFGNAASVLVDAVAPRQAAVNDYFQAYLKAGPAWSAWIVIEVLGVFAGGAVSALLNRRFRIEVVRGPHTGRAQRLRSAAAGGTLMGIGAVLAGGCTSGQALSGGALLSVGSWAFMVAVFAAGYAVMPLFRRLWL